MNPTPLQLLEKQLANEKETARNMQGSIDKATKELGTAKDNLEDQWERIHLYEEAINDLKRGSVKESS